MAKRKGVSESTASEVKAGFRSFSSDTTGFYELNEGDSIEGIFINRRKQTIKDRRTKAMKDIWVYRIRTEEGIINLGGRALLDRQFEDALDDMFGGNLEALKGKRVQINRGEDGQTGDGNPIGQYELLIEDPSARS